MNTKNTKTAVIILLIIANIFFIYNIIDLKIKSENIPSETIENAVNILKKNGFVTDKSKIPVKKPSSSVYEGIYSQNFADIVKNFSGASDEELKGADYIVPAGISYAVGDYRFIFSDTDYFRISIIENLYTDYLKDFSVINPETEKTELEEDTESKIILLSEKGTENAQKSDLKKAENIIRNFLRKYHIQDVKLGFVITGFDEDRQKNCEQVLITQTVDNLPVSSHNAYIEIQDDKVKYFSGIWYFGEFIGNYPMPLLDSVNILFKCLEIDEKTILESGGLSQMATEYTVMHHDTDKFYLLPSWQIKFDSGKKLSYNMITGSKN